MVVSAVKEDGDAGVEVEPQLVVGGLGLADGVADGVGIIFTSPPTGAPRALLSSDLIAMTGECRVKRTGGLTGAALHA